MKKLTTCILCLGLGLMLNHQGIAQNKTKPASKPAVKTSPKPASAPSPAAAPNLKSTSDSVSYAVGILVAQNFKFQGVQLDPTWIAKGFESVNAGTNPLMDLAKCQQVVNDFMQKVQAKAQAEQEKKNEPNRLAGEQFLATNKTKEGVMTTASGLQYQIIQAGNGPKPGTADQVKVHYHGTLIDGTVFDSSVQRGEPITFPVTGVIPGWVEALQLMPQGSKWKLFIPQQLAYGNRQAGDKILPFSALIFEVELLEVIRQSEAPTSNEKEK